MLESIPYEELDLFEIDGIRQYQQVFTAEKLEELTELANQLNGNSFNKEESSLRQ